MPTEKEKYPYVIPEIREWPINKLDNDRDAFMKEVVAETVRNITESKKKSTTLNEEIARVLYMERRRLRDDPWKVDKPDEESFWKDIKKKLISRSLDHVPDEDTFRNNKALVESIINRYVEEMTCRFEPSTYRFAKQMLKRTFRVVLNAATSRSIRRFITGEQMMDDKFKIIGEIDHARELALKGTLVMVPTHLSNLDSVAIGWAADRTGLPAFTYGAGLNLFNSSVFAYFARRLGAYTVDRRKKNAFYLETLKTFSKRAIVRHTHSLFFPGGTRSRSGHIESKLKLGLLGSVVNAQCEHYINNSEEKVFVIPVTLNYHFTIEAKSLIDQYLSNTGKELYLVEKRPFGGYFSFIRFFWKLFRVSSEIIIHYGKPLDVMGNFVDKEGNSFDHFGEPIDVRSYFISNREIKYDRQRNEQYTQRLADRIVERYHAESVVLSSHLIAFTAFSVIRKLHPTLDLYGLLRLTLEECIIPKEIFVEGLNQIVERLLYLASIDKVKLSYQVMHGSPDDIIHHGLQNLGAYHKEKVLYYDKAGRICTQSMNLLYYYHNRLDGYDLARWLYTPGNYTPMRTKEDQADQKARF